MKGVSRRNFSKTMAMGAMGGLAAGSVAPLVAASSSSRVIYFDNQKVRAAFAPDSQLVEGKGANVYGGLLLDWKGGENRYLVRISRRDKTGLSELHESTMHIFHVLEGTVTFVTGGKMVAPKTVEPITPWGGKEIRGTGIEGGDTYHLSKNDVIIVPRGVPHWWKEVEDPPFICFAVNLAVRE